MTKRRAPVSIENTLTLVLGELGIDRAAFITRRSQDYLRALTDPSRREHLTFRDGQALDEDFFLRIDRRHPLRDTYSLVLAANRPEIVAGACDFATHAVTVAREAGEATAALVEATVAGAPIHLCEDAVRQLEESHAATGAAIGVLREHMKRARPP